MMKYLVAVVVSAAILVSVCNAACFRQLPDSSVNGCLYKGKLYERDSKWRTDDCIDCSCDSDRKLVCCTAYVTPVGYDEEKCKFVFNKETCSYDLIPNEDPTKQCKEYSMVG